MATVRATVRRISRGRRHDPPLGVVLRHVVPLREPGLTLGAQADAVAERPPRERSQRRRFDAT